MTEPVPDTSQWGEDEYLCLGCRKHVIGLALVVYDGDPDRTWHLDRQNNLCGPVAKLYRTEGRP